MTSVFAWRYFKSKKSTNAINIISGISVAAIAISTMSLIIVLSVFNGFENLVKGLYGDFYADMRIAPASGKFTTITNAQHQQIKNTANIKGISYVVEEKALLNNESYQSIIFLKGVDDNYNKVTRLDSHILRGKYSFGSLQKPDMIIGAGIESAVGAAPDIPEQLPLVVYLPNRKAKNLQSTEGLFSESINVSGSFSIQQEFDNKYAFTNLAFMQYMLYLKPDEYSAAELSLTDVTKMDETKKALQKILGNNYKVETRYEQNQSLYTVMQVEKWVIYGILCLILIVAAFNMVGALSMLVLEKQKDIAVLKAMGSSAQRIKNIFLQTGIVIAGFGAAIGIVLAVIICLLQQQFHFLKLGGGSFVIDYYPVKMRAVDFLLVAATVLVIAVLASIIPAAKAAKQQFSLKS